MEDLRDHLLTAHGEAVEAILFYGSCLRRDQELEGLADLYVLVDSYRRFYGRGIPALFNKLLPPNVYYLEWPHQDRVLRAKYAVISVADFQRGASTRWHHSYIWGRFAQPAALLYSRDAAASRRVTESLAQSVVTFASRVVPYITPRFTARDLWIQGLQLSYQSELRSEKADRAGLLYETSADYYDRITQAATVALPYPIEVDSGHKTYLSHIPTLARKLNRLGWHLRHFQGKLLSILRLFKAVFTFRGGFEYILWKIERHSGVSVEVSPLARRYPLLAGWGVFWRLYRRGAFR